MSISTRDLHWTAGFLEGDGSFIFSAGNLTVTAVQVQKWPLERLQHLYGGSIKMYLAKHQNHNDFYRWTLTTTPAAGLMMTLYCLMSSGRKAQIKKALDGWKAKAIPQKNRTHCPQGHEYTEENTYVYAKTGQRQCVICRKIHDRNRQPRRRSA